MPFTKDVMTHKILGWLMTKTGHTNMELPDKLIYDEINDYDVRIEPMFERKAIKVTAVESGKRRHSPVFPSYSGEVEPALTHYVGTPPPKPIPGTIREVVHPHTLTEDVKAALDYGMLSVKELEKMLVTKVEIPLKKTVIESSEEVENFRDIEIILEE